MPTEHEFKFVLKMGCEEQIANITGKFLDIKQGYLFSTSGMNARLRSTNKGFTYTFKCNAQRRVVELEQPISKRDFEDLWDNCYTKLRKRRYCWNNKETNEKWDIDFFYCDEVYFCMAECETQEGVAKPLQIPDWIKEHIIYEVAYGDNRFSSVKLSNKFYAQELLENIKNLR